MREKHFTGIALVKTSADLGNGTRMSFFPKSLTDLTGFEVCTRVNPLRKKGFSYCSNSLMGFPPSLGIPQSIHGSWQTLHTTGGLSKETSVWSSPTCGINWEAGPAVSLSSLKLGHTHSVLRHFAQVSVSFFMETTSQETSPTSTGCILDTLCSSLNPKGQRHWHPFNQAQPTPNGSFRDFSSGSEVPIWGTRFWSLVRELKYTCYS